MNKHPFFAVFITSALAFGLTGCSDSTNDVIDDAIEDTIDESGDDASSSDDNILSVDTSLFATESLVSVETVDCTLSNGASTSCYSITISGFPADRSELGDFCPGTITATADEAGKWFDDGVLYDLSGEFIQNLDVFYGDSYWQLYDADTGVVNITDTQEACEAAAQPQVDPQYYNHCVQCDLDYFADETGGGVESTYLIPVTPVLRSSPGNLGGNTGLALNGVNLAAAAPTDAILGAYTIAAFDDCVGHVNPAAGYHYHGANQGDGDCPAIEFEVDGHAGMIGYAMDGFAIYGMLDENGDEPTDLDDCRGQTDDVRGYHYHSAGPGENTFIGCFSGETAN
ncbi:YHYH protein [Paraglaciecola sp. 2405UD69-4]|uniref:YHYH protein n=1 Tax=Paraglaciecola sp. 2405UD69-4 TaxID=3391836 RepID=UPI0039C9151E